jgi:thymidylate synthase ThyX
MTETNARVLLDSISPNGDRLTTIEVTFHRFVLAEFNTHRMFNRNSSSSRAIPVEKQLERFTFDAAMPISMPREQPGMQGGKELEGQDLLDAMELLGAIHSETARLINAYLEAHPDKKTRLHKSVLNRPMEWAQWHTVLVTATEWENFFAQRCHPDAQPEMRAAAEWIREVLGQSVPQPLDFGDWHTPLIQDFERETLSSEDRMNISVARCARVSYLTHDGKRDLEADRDLYRRLLTSRHPSPFEHVATPALKNKQPPGNLRGYHQLRHLMPSLDARTGE